MIYRIPTSNPPKMQIMIVLPWYKHSITNFKFILSILLCNIVCEKIQNLLFEKYIY